MSLYWFWDSELAAEIHDFHSSFDAYFVANRDENGVRAVICCLVNCCPSPPGLPFEQDMVPCLFQCSFLLYFEHVAFVQAVFIEERLPTSNHWDIQQNSQVASESELIWMKNAVPVSDDHLRKDFRFLQLAFHQQFFQVGHFSECQKPRDVWLSDVDGFKGLENSFHSIEVDDHNARNCQVRILLGG